MKNPMGMLKQVQQMQVKMAAVQAELETATVEATVGGGVVTAVATGAQKLVSITIGPDVIGDAEMLPDLVLAAVNEALDRSRAMAAEKMQAVTAGLGLPPGLI
ncbi:MAG TPA: YbaB/EbfC family nucleoid-associated protein [Candidatus Dormibacteraeota bacterium]|nr:YbaB/EbfC family nucleoid-associated protein [Candidatus Dormibacteraeota bacterium]